MKLLVTGASGLVGSAFAKIAGMQGHEVVGIIGQFTGAIAGATRLISVDLADERAAERLVLQENPDAVVNCAAVSVPEACEKDPALAERLNVRLPAVLAAAAQRLNARLVHISSEQVFDGTRLTPYGAGDPVSPINVYARQKVESERLVRAAAPTQAVTVRAPLLMGNSAAGRRSTHERLLGDWSAGKPARLYVDEFRQPCTAHNLAEALFELCGRREMCGIVHWAGAELLSRHALGVQIRARFGLAEVDAPIVPVRRDETPDAARKRQACLGLDIAPLASTLRTRPQTIAQQLTTLVVPDACRAWLEQATSRARR